MTSFFSISAHADTFKVDGVNLGGAYVLEDWFFSDKTVGRHVGTPCTNPDGSKSEVGSIAQFTREPVPAGKNDKFTSEIDLIHKLQKDYGYSNDKIANYFQKHRLNYFNPNDPALLQTFKELKEAGITLVRLPVTWAIQYDKPYTLIGADGKQIIIPAMAASTATKPHHVELIQDPFYTGYYWASIPIKSIERILGAAHANGIKVILDIHAWPGGAGDGTYNGIWPLPPKFWTANYEQNYRTIFQQLISWAQTLKTSYPDGFAGLAGLTPMNEPAHLMGIRFVTCDPNANWGVKHDNVLNTLATSITDFKNSTLPASGVKLYMNVIETMFPQGTDALKDIGTWWKNNTTQAERTSWAVLDIHHYLAWDGANYNYCLNKVNGGEYEFLSPDPHKPGAYIIKPAEFDNLKGAANWYANLRKNLGLTDGSLLMASEFSASTNEDTWASCASGHAQDNTGKPIDITNHKEYRNTILAEQLAKAKEGNISMIFWTWKLPYNSNFQNEWSFYNVICSQDPAPQFCH
jgi:aryl-phospho-beta-D-glucosidase BglC (GH1 family)